MRAVIDANTGDASVLQVVERSVPEPAGGEMRIRVVVSGVNPTDWNSRSGAFGGAHHVVDHHDTDAADRIRRVAPAGVDVIVEVEAGANAELDQSVLKPRLRGRGRSCGGPARIARVPDGACESAGSGQCARHAARLVTAFAWRRAP